MRSDYSAPISRNSNPLMPGSQTVELLQKAVGVKADGIWFEDTTLALQQAMNRNPGFLRR